LVVVKHKIKNNGKFLFSFLIHRNIYLNHFLFRYGVALYYPPGNFPNQYYENVQQRSDLEQNRLA
jgi:hypothetical protein